MAVPTDRAMLVIGHPGHELRVHGWLECARPVVMVLTDGSGHDGPSRLPSTSVLFRNAGATPGSVFGRFTDAALYRALLDRETDRFVALAQELATAIDQHDVDVVVGDDAEGYNPTHDVCRYVVNAAVQMARVGRARPLTNLAFALMTRPDAVAVASSAVPIRFTLDEAALERKMAAALAYPEMAGEVAAARREWGDRAFAVETFREVPRDDEWTPGEGAPFYERHGAKRVAEGLYSEVIRFDTHIRPLLEALSIQCGPAAR